MTPMFGWLLKMNDEHRKQKRAGDARPWYQCAAGTMWTFLAGIVFVSRAVQLIERFHRTPILSAYWVA